MNKLLFIFCLLATQVVFAQNAPDIQQARINISQGNVHGFVLLLPGVNPDLAKEIWIAYANNLLAPNQPGVGHPRVPTVADDYPDDNEFKTVGIYLPQISNHFIDAYVVLDSVTADADSVVVSPTTRFSIAFDLGQKHFSNSDDDENAQKFFKILRKFYDTVLETLAMEEKK